MPPILLSPPRRTNFFTATTRVFGAGLYRDCWHQTCAPNRSRKRYFICCSLFPIRSLVTGSWCQDWATCAPAVYPGWSLRSRRAVTSVVRQRNDLPSISDVSETSRTLVCDMSLSGLCVSFVCGMKFCVVVLAVLAVSFLICFVFVRFCPMA